MINKDVLLPHRQDLLLSPTDPSINHPLHLTLQLRAETVLEKMQKPHKTQKGCKSYSWHLGHAEHKPILIPTVFNNWYMLHKYLHLLLLVYDL